MIGKKEEKKHGTGKYVKGENKREKYGGKASKSQFAS